VAFGAWSVVDQDEFLLDQWNRDLRAAICGGSACVLT
jgi:hypothetical protein